MKQIIVMIAMVVLGIAIGTMVMGFTAQAENIKDAGVNVITEYTQTVDPEGL